jgi:hypothetical protein
MSLPAGSSSSAQPATSIVLEGLRKLRTAALLQIIAVVIATAASFSALGALLTGNALAILAAGASTIALALIAIVLLLVAVYAFLLPSAKSFASWRPAEFSTPSKLLRIGFLWGLVVVLIALLLALTVILVLVALALAVVGVILVIIGWVGLIIYFFKLRDAFNSTLFLVAAILTILVIVPVVGGILGFIAWILVLVESGTIMKRIESGEIKL